MALAASAIGLKKAPESSALALECRDLILASVVHACQDHSQRVRYYATESLFNVVKVIPSLAVQHFFILFEILRSLYADVDVDVKSGAELLDKKLKEVIVGAMNSGQFSADACVPVFCRFVQLRNKATQRLTLSWLQELAEKLIGSPILEFLHLLLGGIFDMVADPTLAIRQSALAFLQSVLPKLLTVEEAREQQAIDDMTEETKVDFDKILQSLVTTMEHPDPFVRKVAMFWMSRIIQKHLISGNTSAATLSVRNSLPHVLPGILLSIGDTFVSSTKDSFLPDTTTHALAEQTNACLQDAVRKDGGLYVHHLDSFIVALREELDAPSARQHNVERKPYRMDVKQDGTGIETTGWFRGSTDTRDSVATFVKLLDGERHLRVEPAEPRQQPRQPVGRDRRDHSEPEGAPALGRRRLRRLHQRPGIAQQPPRPTDHLLAARGHQHARPRALEDRHAEQVLDLAHLAAQRRLAHATSARCLDELARLGDRDHVLQLAQGRQHAHAPGVCAP